MFATINALTLVSLITFQAGIAHADDCLGSSIEVVAPRDPTRVVDLRQPDARAGWLARVRPVHDDAVAWQRLPILRSHAHVIVAFGEHSDRFVVIDAGGETEDADRVLVYAPAADGSLVLERRLALSDLLTPDELAATRRSISHVQWLAARSKDGGPPVRLVPGRAAVELTLRSGRRVLIDL